MNSGAYGSYPSNTRYSGNRNYKFGKALRKKGYRRRANPLAQYTYRKTRIGRLTKTNMQSEKCTFTDTVLLDAGGVVYLFNSTGTAYLNLSAILLGSPEFVSRQTQYSYYMISGISVAASRMWMDPIAFGVDGVSSGFTAVSYNGGIEKMSLNFYPNLKTSTVGQPVEDADSSWEISPFIYGDQTHYQPFPKNFTTGTNSNGLGVWNACSQATNIQGEIAIYNSASGVQASTFGQINLWDLEINVYCSFCNNTGA